MTTFDKQTPDLYWSVAAGELEMCIGYPAVMRSGDNLTILGHGTLIGVCFGEVARFDFWPGGKYDVPTSLVTRPSDSFPRWFTSFIHYPILDDVRRWKTICIAIHGTADRPACNLANPSDDAVAEREE